MLEWKPTGAQQALGEWEKYTTVSLCKGLSSLVPRPRGTRLGFIELPKAVNLPLVSPNHSPYHYGYNICRVLVQGC